MKKLILWGLLFVGLTILTFTPSRAESFNFQDFYSNVFTLPPAKERVLKVSIKSNRQPNHQKGEVITLTSLLEGFDGLIVCYQWQVDKKDGSGFVDIPEATEESYSYAAAVETLGYDYRLIINYEKRKIDK